MADDGAAGPAPDEGCAAAAEAAERLPPGTQLTHAQAHASYGDGRHWMANGDPEAAIPCFSKAILLDPNVPRFYAQRAEAYAAVLDFKSAVVNLRKALDLSPDDHAVKTRLAGMLDVQGHILLDAGQHAKAVSYFTEAISVVTLQASFWLHRALAFVGMQDWAKALHDVEQCLCMHAGDPEVLVLRAKLHRRLGDEEAAARDFRKAMALAPQHPEVEKFTQRMWELTESVFKAASDALLESNFTLAVRLLTEALEYSPSDMKIRLMRASAFRQLKRFAEAMADVDHCARVYGEANDLDNVATWQADADLHTISDSAIVELVGEAALEDDAKRRRRLEEEARRKAEAERAPSDQTTHPEIIRQRNLIHNDMALDAMKREDYDAAITLFNRVLESELVTAERFEGNVIDPRFYVNRGDCHRLSGRYQQALADYHAAFDLHPDSWEVKTRLSMLHYHFGIALFNRGEYAQSEAEFAVAVEYNPKVSVYYEHRSEAAFYQGKYEEAHRMLLRAIKLDPTNNLLRAKLVQFQGRIQPAKLPSRAGGVAQARREAEALMRATRPRPPPSGSYRLGARKRRDKQIRAIFTDRIDLAKADMAWLLDASTKMEALSKNVRGRQMPREGGVAPSHTYKL